MLSSDFGVLAQLRVVPTPGHEDDWRARPGSGGTLVLHHCHLVSLADPAGLPILTHEHLPPPPFRDVYAWLDGQTRYRWDVAESRVVHAAGPFEVVRTNMAIPRYGRVHLRCTHCGCVALSRSWSQRHHMTQDAVDHTCYVNDGRGLPWRRRWVKP